MGSDTTVPPKLESPGAGLLALELALLQTLFRCACAVISLEGGLRWFKFEARKITVLAGSVSTEQGALPVLIDRVVGIEDSSRYWSVFMVLDHLRIVDEGMTQINEAPRSKLRGITEHSFEDFSETELNPVASYGEDSSSSSDRRSSLWTRGSHSRCETEPSEWPRDDRQVPQRGGWL